MCLGPGISQTMPDRLFYTLTHISTNTQIQSLLMSQQAFRGARVETIKQTPVSMNFAQELSVTEKQSHMSNNCGKYDFVSLSTVHILFTLEMI